MERTQKCYGRTDGQIDGQTEVIPIIPSQLGGRGLTNSCWRLLHLNDVKRGQEN